MARILVFQHVAAEPLGTFDPLIRARGHRIRYINFSREPDAVPRGEKYDALVILGGPMMPDQHRQYPHLAVECRTIEQFIAQDKPVLGICLGSQLIAHTLGARLHPASEWEIGWYPLHITPEGQDDDLLRHYPHQQPVYQWHGYTFEKPASAQHLAQSSACDMQAFRYGEQCWGFQFHLELDQRLIKRWLSLPAYLEELDRANLPHTAEQIVGHTREHIDRSVNTSKTVFDAFLDRLPGGERVVLKSR